MAKGIFITATGTDVGKTYVSALLVKQLRERGILCDYYKPVLSGAIIHVNEVLAEDAEFVCNTAGLDGDPLARVSYTFEPAVSPHLAAGMEGRTIVLEKIIEDYKHIASKNDFTVVEGAGGIITPLDLDIKLFMYDIPEVLGLDTIVVADAGLGSINSTFLTVDFLKRTPVKVKGVILNNFAKEDFMHLDNLKVIELLCGVKVLGTVAKDGDGIEFTAGAIEALYA